MRGDYHEVHLKNESHVYPKQLTIDLYTCETNVQFWSSELGYKAGHNERWVRIQPPIVAVAFGGCVRRVMMVAMRLA